MGSVMTRLPKGSRPLRRGERELWEALRQKAPPARTSKASEGQSKAQTIHRVRCLECLAEIWAMPREIPLTCGVCGGSLPLKRMGSVTGTDVGSWVREPGSWDLTRRVKSGK